MVSIHQELPDKSKAKLFEHLVNCNFLSCTKKDCPIWEQRNCLSVEKKYAYAMRLSTGKIKRILSQYNCSYEKRLSELSQW
jgi:hypothetical protein